MVTDTELFSRLIFKFNKDILVADNLVNLDTVNFIMPNNLISVDYLIVSCLFYLKNKKVENGKTYLKFESEFENFWNTTISNSSGLYLKFNNQIIKLNQELSTDNQVLYYVTGEYNFSVSVEVFKYQEVESVEESKNRNYLIELSGDLREELMVHQIFINNIKVLLDDQQISYLKMEVIDTNKINLVTTNLLEKSQIKSNIILTWEKLFLLSE